MSFVCVSRRSKVFGHYDSHLFLSPIKDCTILKAILKEHTSVTHFCVSVCDRADMGCLHLTCSDREDDDHSPSRIFLLSRAPSSASPV